MKHFSSIEKIHSEKRVPSINVRDIDQVHYVKSVQKQILFLSEYRKIRTRKNFGFGHFPRSSMVLHICILSKLGCLCSLNLCSG